MEREGSRDGNNERRGLGGKIEDVEGRGIKPAVSGGKRTKWSHVRRSWRMLGKGAGCREQVADRGQHEGGPHLEQLTAFSRK